MKITLKIIPIIILFIFTSCKENTKEASVVKTDLFGIDWVCVYAGKDVEKTIQFFGETLGLHLHQNLDFAAVFHLPSKQTFDVYKYKMEGAEKSPLFGFGTNNLKETKIKAKERGTVFIDEMAGGVQGIAFWEFTKDPDNNFVQISTGDDSVQTITPSENTPNITPTGDLKIKGIKLIEIYVSDLQKSTNYYKNKLLLNEVSTSKNKALFKVEDGTYLKLTEIVDNQNGIDYPVIGFEVANLSKAIKVLTDKEVQLIRGVEKDALFTRQSFQGPDNIVYNLVTLNK